MATGNLYEVLGLSQGADQAVIAAAYRALAKKYHPDTAHGDKAAAAEHFKRIQGAYEVLGNAEARSEYNERLRRSVENIIQSAHPFETESPRPTYQRPFYTGKTSSKKRSGGSNWWYLVRVMAVASVIVAIGIAKFEPGTFGESNLQFPRATPAVHSQSPNPALETNILKSDRTETGQSGLQTAKGNQGLGKDQTRIVASAGSITGSVAPPDEPKAKPSDFEPGLGPLQINPNIAGLLSTGAIVVFGDSGSTAGQTLFDFRQRDNKGVDSITLSPAERNVLHANIQASAPDLANGRMIACRVNYASYENGLALCRVGHRGESPSFRSFICKYWQNRPCADAGLHDAEHDISEEDFPAIYAQKTSSP